MSKTRYIRDHRMSQHSSEAERFFIHQDQIDPYYSPSSLSQDKDVFFTGSTFYSVRVEQSANDSSYHSGNIGASEIDDATLHIDDALEDEEVVNPNLDFIDAHESAYRLQQLETELETMRRENHDLRLMMESYKASQSQRAFNGGVDSSGEEIIEEIPTIQHNRPTVKKLDKSVQLDRTGVINGGVDMLDTSRYHMIDLHSKTIEESHFPSDYWSRLEQLFKKRFNSARPSTRNTAFQSSLVAHRSAATMATPSTDKEQRCFGVSVRPMTRDVGVLWHSGIPTSEQDTAVRIWLNRQFPQLSDPTRCTITRLLRSSRESREEFVKTILTIIKKDTKTIASEVKPQQQSQSTTTGHSVEPELIPSTKVASSKPTESQLIEARPISEDKYTLTTPLPGTSVAVETDVCLLRSQGSQVTPEAPDITCCGIQTDAGPSKTNRGTNPHAQRTHVQCTTHFSPISSEKVDRSYEAWTSAEPSGVQSEPTRRRFIPNVTKQRNSRRVTGSLERSSSTTSSYSHTIQLRSSRPLSPAEVQQLFPSAVYVPSSMQQDVASDVQSNVPQDVTPDVETTQSAPCRTTNSQSSDRFSFLTKRRLIDENSPRHLVPGDVDVERLSHNGVEVVGDVLSRSKPVSTTHVTYHFDRDLSLVSSGPSDLPSPLSVRLEEAASLKNMHPSPTVDKKVYNIPVVHTPPGTRKDSGTKPSDKSAPTPDHSTASRGHANVSSTGVFPTYGIRDFTVEITDPTRPVQSTPSSATVRASPLQHSTTEADRSFGARTTHPQAPRPPPAFSHVSRRFILSADTKKTCERLMDHYKSGHSPQNNVEMASDLTNLSHVWFQLTSSMNIHMTQVADFLAILHEYSEQLVRDVVRSSNDQGATCLHLAVGHGALSVIQLILDSGYAEPDRLNTAGYSAVMIAAMSPLITTDALTILNRLFSMGNVNLRSTAGSLQTPLMIAAQNGSVEVLHLLLQNGASVNTQDSSGNTALMFGIQRGSHDIIGALLDRPDSDLSLKDNRGDDVMAIALRKNDPTVIEWIQNVLKHGKRSLTAPITPPTVLKFAEKKHVRQILRDLQAAHNSVC